jgi:hypothetical protein
VEVSFLISTEVAVSYFVFWFQHHQIFSISNRLPFLKMKEVHMVQGRENMEVAERLGFRVRLRKIAQVATSALARFRCELASFLTTSFLVACGVLLRGDTADLVNNIP